MKLLEVIFASAEKTLQITLRKQTSINMPAIYHSKKGEPIKVRLLYSSYQPAGSMATGIRDT